MSRAISKPLDFDQMLSGAGALRHPMMTTNARHIALSTSRRGKFEDHETPDQESNPNGNAVALEKQMIKVSDTQAQFQAAANLYAKAMTHDEDGDRPLIEHLNS